ncbi:MAG: archaemetzincin, partial [Nannocystaceae bacterium]
RGECLREPHLRLRLRPRTARSDRHHPGHLPDEQRDTLYFLPIGQFPNGLVVEEERTVLVRSPEMKLLADHAERYFGLKTAILPAVEIEALNPKTRNVDGRTQYRTVDLLSRIRPLLPADGYSVIALTNEDLFTESGQEFSFGYASLNARVGVYSFARFDPQFSGEPRGPDFRQVILARSLKIMTHEVGHMFGLEHCTYYSCVMNGVSDLIETDRHPLHMCPVCLRKLHGAVGFEPVARYLELQEYYARVELANEARWVADRATFITGEY